MTQTPISAAAAAISSLAASVIMLSPFTSPAHIGSALNTGDGRLQAWVLAWTAHALMNALPVFDANMFYPTQAALASTDHFFALGVLGAPLWIASGNAVLVFNVLQLLGPAVTSFSAFLLLLSWTNDWLASLAGGLSFGLSFFIMLHNSHLGLTWAAGLPLAVLLLERWWERPTWMRLAGLWAACLLTALTSWYLAVLLGVLVVLRAIPLVAAAHFRDLGARVPQAIAGLALGAALLLPFGAPYFNRVNEPGEAAGLATDPSSYVVPPGHTVVGRWLVQHGLATPRSIWGERSVFLGWTTIGLAAAGLVAGLRSHQRERRTRTRFILAALLIAAGLSFGPSATGLAPFDLLSSLPGFRGLRSSARFALLVAFAMSVLAAFGLVGLRRLMPRAAPAAIIVITVVMSAERFVVDFPAGKPRPEAMPVEYALARADGARAALALPMYAAQPGWFFETDYLLYSTTADFLPLANGYGRWAPPEYLALAEVTQVFPSSSAAAALRLYGITHVILHGDRYGERGPDVLARAQQSADFEVVARNGSTVLLRIRPQRVSQDRTYQP